MNYPFCPYSNRLGSIGSDQFSRCVPCSPIRVLLLLSTLDLSSIGVAQSAAAPAAELVAGRRGSRSERERHRPPWLQAETGAASCWNGACRTGSSPSSVRLMPSSPAAAAGRKLVLQLAALLSTRVCSWPGSLRMAALLHLGGAARTAAHGTASPATQSGRSSRSLFEWQPPIGTDALQQHVHEHERGETEREGRRRTRERRGCTDRSICVQSIRIRGKIGSSCA